MPKIILKQGFKPRVCNIPIPARIATLMPAPIQPIPARIATLMPAPIQPIPMIFHFIWLGPKPMPTKYTTTWITLHPKWKIMLWNDNNLPKMINQHLFEKSKYYSQKSDILRYEILWNYGGVYLDVDFECTRNIESLLKGVARFAAFQREKEINSAILGSTPKDNWMLSIIEKLPYFFKEKYRAETGPNLVTDRTINRRDVTVFQKELFYPYLWNEPEKAKGPFPNSYGVHHWSKLWSTRTPDIE